MALSYQDFFPTVLKSGLFSTEYEAFPATVARAGEWLAQAGVRVINIETVVLPNIQTVEGASVVGIQAGGQVSSRWCQFVRVWYEEAKPSPN